MHIESLDLEDRIKQLIINQDGIKELYPPQGDAIKKGLLSGKNLVISIPTAAGKTLLAELAALKHVTELNGKVIYLCPLRALASEKFKDFKRFNSLGIRTAITSGDYDSKDDYLPKYDIIVSTNEKFDALLRHRATWITEEVSLIIIDECHLINDQHRGPTLETLLARLMLKNTNSQIIALSATIGNADEIAEWLDAELVLSDWRPVPLKEGVYFEDQITYSDYSTREIPFQREDQLTNLALDSIHSQEQMLIFTPSRRSAVSTAEKLGLILEPFIEPKDAKKLTEIATKVVLNLSDPLSKKLANIIKKGVAFHHAGLNSQQRDLVETGFKAGYIKTICATPTLCLSQDTMVWHDLNETRISKYDINHSIFALNKNKLVKVNPKEIITFESTSNLIQIDSVAGYSIKVTPNHRLLVKRNGHRTLLPAGIIKKKDKIATIGNLNSSNDSMCQIRDFVLDNKANKKFYKFDNDILYFLGLMLGDGHSGAETKNEDIIYKGSPSIVNNEEYIIDFCIKVCLKLGIHYRKIRNSYGTPTLVFSKTKWFREFLVRCGVEMGESKYIPSKIMNSSKERISFLLKGLFDSDGYVNKGRNIGFSNISKILIKSTQKLLLRFGIVCRLRKRKGGEMKPYNKKYITKPHYELIIAHKKSIMKFKKFIGFNLREKQSDLDDLVFQFNKNIHYVSCAECKYKIYRDLFSGRSKAHKRWAVQKIEVIKCLGDNGELGSRMLKKKLGFPPRKNDLRLNHHYELIKKRRFGNNEWLWSLNEIGTWIYRNLLIKDESKFSDFFKINSCPLCDTSLNLEIKKGWKDNDFDGDIYFDTIRTIREVEKESSVYDVVLSDSPQNDHMFVADGFIVHNSAGINIPAKRVIVTSVYRYSVEEGSHPIKTLEYKQMAGRGGRPQFDTEGEAILLAKKPDVLDWLMDRYINRDAEDIYSKLAAKPALRRNILGLIASRVVTDIQGLLVFFEKTFYGYQFEAVFLESKIREVVDLLIGWQMINPLDANETLEATPYGIRISQLYLDPETAATIAEGLISAVQQKRLKIHPVAILDLVVGTPDMISLSFRRSDWGITEKRFKKFESRLFREIPDPFDIEYEFRLRDFRTTLFLWDWIKELPIEKLIMRYNIGSGDIHRIVETATWIVSAAAEIAELHSRKNKNYRIIARAAQSLSKRVEYGIESEAVSLTRVRGIGRKRARILLEHGIKDIARLLTLTKQDLVRIPGFGPELAEAVLYEANLLMKTEGESEIFDNDHENSYFT